MCGSSPDVPDKPDPAAEPADIFLGEQDSVENSQNQRLGLRRFKMLPEKPQQKQTGLRIE